MGSLTGFIKGGGLMMYPLILCSVLLVTIIIERIVAYRRAAVDGDWLLEEVRSALSGGGAPSSAAAVCEAVKRPLGRVFARGLKNAHRDAEAIELALDLESSNETPALEANLPILRTIINISPLLGLLGTIAGMITSFRAAQQGGLSNPQQILGGISEALISTATGISLAVIGFIAYNYFTNQSRKIQEDLDYYCAELVNLITGRID